MLKTPFTATFLLTDSFNRAVRFQIPSFERSFDAWMVLMKRCRVGDSQHGNVARMDLHDENPVVHFVQTDQVRADIIVAAS